MTQPGARGGEETKAIGPRARQRIHEALEAIAARGTRGNWMALIRSTNGIITIHEVNAPWAAHIKNRPTRH